jgi:phage pi2 protein 07
MRYMRIRNDLVEALKDPELNKDEVKSIITNIYAVDSIVKDTIEYNTLIDSFLNIFSSSDRNAGKSIREEQLLEELATNMLFVKAAELRLLA